MLTGVLLRMKRKYKMFWILFIVFALLLTAGLTLLILLL